MPAGKRLGLVQKDQDVNEAIRNIAEFHISAVRRTQAGAITSVKHIAMGWMTVAEWYNLQKVHDLVPFAIEFIKGGYMLKAALYTVTIPVDIFASGSSFPFGLAIISVAVLLAALDSSAGNSFYSALDILCLLLPFGEIWLLYRGSQLLYNFFNQGGKLQQITGIFSYDEWLIGLLPGGDVIVNYWNTVLGQLGSDIGSLGQVGNAITKWFASI